MALALGAASPCEIAAIRPADGSACHTLRGWLVSGHSQGCRRRAQIGSCVGALIAAAFERQAAEARRDKDTYMPWPGSGNPGHDPLHAPPVPATVVNTGVRPRRVLSLSLDHALRTWTVTVSDAIPFATTTRRYRPGACREVREHWWYEPLCQWREYPPRRPGQPGPVRGAATLSGDPHRRVAEGAEVVHSAVGRVRQPHDWVVRRHLRVVAVAACLGQAVELGGP